VTVLLLSLDDYTSCIRSFRLDQEAQDQMMSRGRFVLSTAHGEIEYVSLALSNAEPQKPTRD